MKLETRKCRSGQEVPETIGEILTFKVPVVIEYHLPDEELSGILRRMRDSGMDIKDKIFYSDADSDRFYCGGTFVNDIINQRHWKLDAIERIFIPYDGVYRTRHFDKLMGTADFYLFKGYFTDFLTEVSEEGFVFQE